MEVKGPTTRQENVTASWEEYARAGFSKYVFVHGERLREEAEKCVPVGSLRPVLGHGEWEMAAGEMDDAGAGKVFQSTRKTVRKRLHYEKVFHGDQRRDRSVLRELELVAGKMLRWEAVSKRVV